ncbi:MAG TPA: LysE family transporter [Anaerolineales bacterium]
MMPTDSPLAVFLFAFGVSIGAVISPGPVSAAIISESPRQGWRVGPLVAAAHVGLEAVVVLLISLGLASGMATPAIQRSVALGGGLLLLFIGGSYLVGVWRGRLRLPKPDAGAPRLTTGRMLALGVGTTLSNPFWYAWWVTVAAGFLSQARPLGWAGPLAFYLGHLTADMAWDTLLSTATSLGGRWLTDRSYRWLLVLTGGFMLYLGAAFLRTGLGLG